MKRFLTSALVAGLLVAPQAYADDVTVNVGGRLHHDFSVGLNSDDDLTAAVGELNTGTTIRRARVKVSGDIGDVASYKAEYDFAGGDADFADVTITLKDVGGLGDIKAGHFKESLGLEELTSSNDITFIERSLLSAFTPGRNHGFQGGTALGDINLAVGVFRNTDSYATETGKDSSWNYTLRAHTPVMDDEDGLVHVGLAYSFNNVDDSVSYSSNEVNQGPTLVDTGAVAADNAGIVGVELAAVFGALSVQAEYMNADVDSDGGSDPSFDGWYAQVSYFLTGESRPYNAGKGNFGRVVPEGDDGAVELAARFSSVDLNDSDAGVAGGEQDNITIGVNWYLHKHLRAMLNYVNQDLDTVGDNHSLVARVQADF